MTGPSVVIEATARLRLRDLAAAWQERDVLYILVWRGLKLRYKQTVIGAAWAVIQPLLTTLVLAAVFGVFVQMPSEGMPYPLFAFVGLVAWTYFSQAVTESCTSLVSDQQLLTKVYFPRIFLPLATVIRPLVDLGIALVVALGLMAWYDAELVWSVLALPRRVLALPFFLLMAVTTALGAGLWLSSLNVRYRDIGHTFPLLIQLWLFASPVAYPDSVVPDPWQEVYALNPLVAVIEGVRWSLLGTPPPELEVVLIGTAVAAALLLSGAHVFRRLERTFADFV